VPCRVARARISQATNLPKPFAVGKYRL